MTTEDHHQPRRQLACRQQLAHRQQESTQKLTAIGLHLSGVKLSGRKRPHPAQQTAARQEAAAQETSRPGRRRRTRIVEAPNDLFNNGTPDDIFISPHFKKWNPIADGRREETPVDKEDFTHMIPGSLNRLLKKQGKQNERDMQDILGHTEGKAKN
jgi:hypothetical protein